MARDRLKKELDRYLAKGEEEARKELARTYQQEVILHVDDWADSMFKSWNSQSAAAGKSTIDLRKTKAEDYKSLRKHFREGGKVTVDSLYKSLKRLRQPKGGSAWEGSYMETQKHTDMLVIYLLRPTYFNWEDSQVSGALGRAKNKGIDKINELLEKEGKYKRRLQKGRSGAGSDLWGHHGGITGADPDSTYGLAGAQRGVDNLNPNFDDKLWNPVTDDDDQLESYSDLFWKSLGEDATFKAMWVANQHTRRPTGKHIPAAYNGTHKMRIVMGHKSLKSVKGGTDKLSSGTGRSGWTSLGPALDELLDSIRDDVEERVMQDWGYKADQLEGSESPRTKIRKLAAETVVVRLGAGAKKGAKKSKKVKVTTKVDPVKKSGTQKTELKAKGRTKGRSVKGSSRGSRNPVKQKPKRGQSRATVKTTASPIGLAALLNRSLAKELMKNMGPYPRRLENRTGRFASSAEVTNVAPYPNSVEIQYTYQKDPYAVFEPENGNAMSSWGRDPKRLIGGTIRELAQQMMGTKFGIVRTKRV